MGSMKRFRFSRGRVIGGGVLLCALLLWLGFRQLTGPAEGHIVRPSGATITTKVTKESPVATDMTQQKLSSVYFDLTLPPGYRLQPNTQASAGLLYQQTIIKPSSFGSLVVAISLKTLPEGGVNNDPSYTTRHEQPAQYQASVRQIKGDTVFLFADTEHASTVAFWPHSNYLATIGISAGISNPGGDTTDQRSVLEALLDAWQWR